MTDRELLEAAGTDCPNIGEPRNCYRVRCQLGKKCVEPKQITSAQREKIVRNAIAERDAALAGPCAAPQDEHGLKAFAQYLKDCEDCQIVPDVAGAFHWAWMHQKP